MILVIWNSPDGCTIIWLLKRVTASPRHLSLWFHTGSAPDFGTGKGKPTLQLSSTSVPISSQVVAFAFVAS